MVSRPAEFSVRLLLLLLLLAALPEANNMTAQVAGETTLAKDVTQLPVTPLLLLLVFF